MYIAANRISSTLFDEATRALNLVQFPRKYCIFVFGQMPRQMQRDAEAFPEEEVLHLHSWMPMDIIYNTQSATLLLQPLFANTTGFDI